MKNKAIQFNGIKVLTTRYLANLLEVTPSLITSVANGCIKKNKVFSNRQFDSLIEGTDCLLLQGRDRLSFVDNNRNAYLDISHRGAKFRIFTKSGVIKMARNLKRLNLYFHRIHKYFYEEDLTEFYAKNKIYFEMLDTSEKSMVKFYKEGSIQIQLDQMNNKLEEVSRKVDNQGMEFNTRLAFLEERIDKIILSKFGISN